MLSGWLSFGIMSMPSADPIALHKEICHAGKLPLIMCAFWPQATTSHPLLSLTWQPRILGGFPKLFCITCQKEILTDLL